MMFKQNLRYIYATFNSDSIDHTFVLCYISTNLKSYVSTGQSVGAEDAHKSVNASVILVTNLADLWAFLFLGDPSRGQVRG